MSAAKRRVKRQIARLVRMDATYYRIVRRGQHQKAANFGQVAVALANALNQKHGIDRMYEIVHEARVERGDWA